MQTCNHLCGAQEFPLLVRCCDSNSRGRGQCNHQEADKSGEPTRELKVDAGFAGARWGPWLASCNHLLERANLIVCIRRRLRFCSSSWLINWNRESGRPISLRATGPTPVLVHEPSQFNLMARRAPPPPPPLDLLGHRCSRGGGPQRGASESHQSASIRVAPPLEGLESARDRHGHRQGRRTPVRPQFV